jgi:hypothetical protein
MLHSASRPRAHGRTPQIHRRLPRAVAPSSSVDGFVQFDAAGERATDYRADRALRAVWHFFGGEVRGNEDSNDVPSQNTTAATCTFTMLPISADVCVLF